MTKNEDATHKTVWMWYICGLSCQLLYFMCIEPFLVRHIWSQWLTRTQCIKGERNTIDLNLFVCFFLLKSLQFHSFIHAIHRWIDIRNQFRDYVVWKFIREKKNTYTPQYVFKVQSKVVMMPIRPMKKCVNKIRNDFSLIEPKKASKLYWLSNFFIFKHNLNHLIRIKVVFSQTFYEHIRYFMSNTRHILYRWWIFHLPLNVFPLALDILSEAREKCVGKKNSKKTHFLLSSIPYLFDWLVGWIEHIYFSGKKKEN